ncbi:inactivation-no-after-potential D protein isoform X2 [Chironomus tepperi]|uniref:inactivation-no-after-potential D protein isoform X2 n=1 Tax=Chironomus tepperi TaxID=113505 RepID=UPI00391F4988
MLRLISYSSADSFIKRDYVLDVIDKNSKFTEHQHNAELSSYNFIHLTSVNSLKAYSMSKEGSKRFLVQHRREYYNDFEDCLRDFKNQKIKSIQKQTKVHHSDGDNGESDSEYVDCTDNSSDFKQQSTLSSKSLPHVPVDNYHDESDYYKFTTKMPAASSVHVTTTTTTTSSRTICNQIDTRTSDIMATTKAQKSPQKLKIKSNDGTQLNKNYDDCRRYTQNECTEQLKAHNRNNKNSSNSNNNNNSCSSSSYNKNNQNNQVVDRRTGSIDKVNVNEKSISIDKCPSTSAVPLIDDNKISKKPQVVSLTQQLPQLVDNSTVEVRVVTKQPAAIINDDVSATINAKKDDMKRKSCKKRQGSIKDPTQRKMTVTTVTDNKINNNLDDTTWSLEREVVLERVENKSFGISIVGGKVNVSGDSLVSGIFIKNIIAGSSADLCGLLKVGDRILAVDGIDIRHSSHDVAVKTIKNAGDKMTLRVQSLNTGNADESTIDFIKKIPPPLTPAKTPIPEIIQEGLEKEDLKEEMKDDIKPMQPLIKEPKKSASNGAMSPEIDDEDQLMVMVNRSSGFTPVPDTESEGSSDEDEDNREMEGKTYTASGNEIDRASAGNVKRSKEEVAADPEKESDFGYTMNKIKKRYGSLGTVLCHTIDRGNCTSIGISLAGHRDRNKMACFIAGINPKGIASSAGGLEIGDEILEVNGIVLHGRCHLNASAIIKGLPGPVIQFIVLRRRQALEDLAVKPVTQFPVEISNEDAFATFKNVRHVSIKKGNQSLGIMIIEGKHAEVGQGIFVSDIQEGSNAERAGLSIGDMILAVNKDSLLGCNYETAASMLKKTEGVVVLTVCNPNKKDNEVVKKDIEQPEVTKGPSRPVTPKPQPSPAKEVASDPTTCEIPCNHNTMIEIKLENNPIGIQVAGGCDTLVNTGAVIVNILPGSIAEKDKRLQVFDQILEINSTKITPELTCELIQRAVKQVQSKVKMTIYRADPPEVETIDVEITKKPGKNLGIGFFTSNPRGMFVTDIVSGGLADLDGRIQKSDIVTHVNSEKVSNMSLDDCSTLLKSIQGKVAFKVLRAKPKKRSS